MASFTYNDPPADATSRMRLLVTDIDFTTTAGNRDLWTALFTDEEYAAFLAMSLGAGTPQIFRAAAKALRSIAISRALIARQFRIGSYSENTEKAADVLNAKAEEYEKLADKIEGPYSSYVSYDWTTFAYRARLWREEIMNL